MIENDFCSSDRVKEVNAIGLGLELGLELGHGPGNALAEFFFLWSYKCSEHPVW